VKEKVEAKNNVDPPPPKKARNLKRPISSPRERFGWASIGLGSAMPTTHTQVRAI